MAGWIEIAYALPDRQRIVRLEFVDGITAGEAVRAARLADEFPELSIRQLPIGIYGEIVPQDRVLQPGDRVEIYRELRMDPREARRQRAAQQSSRSVRPS